MAPMAEITTLRQAAAYYDSLYYSLVNSGRAHPVAYPWISIGPTIVLIYLLVDHRRRPWLRQCRWFVFAFSLALSAHSLLFARARGPAPAFGVGLIACFSSIWMAASTVINDFQTDFRRIEYRQRKEVLKANGNGTHIPKGPTSTATTNGHPRRRKTSVKSIHSYDTALQDHTLTNESQFVWQSFPDTLSMTRVDWLFDLITSFRGVGWNWQRSCIPSAPPYVDFDMHGLEPDSIESKRGHSVKNGIKRYFSTKTLARVALTRLLLGYIALDAIKTIMSHDRYFWLPMPAEADRQALPPPAWFPSSSVQFAAAIRFYRLFISLFAVQAMLWSTFNLGPLFFCLVLRPRVMGLRGESWMNPDMFGNLEPVFTAGLAGWWGAHWHQVFRFSFEEAAKAILAMCGVSKRSFTGRLIAVMTAFTLSGLLHAAGSYTTLLETNPFTGPMVFFLLQGCGIILQSLLITALARVGVVARTPLHLRRLSNFIFTYAWLYFTAHLLVDDFAAAGIYLFEPVPVSLFRGLKLGAEDEGWLCWHRSAIFWHSGQHWWDSGVAV